MSSKKDESMKRLQDLKLRRNEARKLNHHEVVEEDRRNKLPTNWEARQMRAQWELEDMEKRKEAEEQGLDYDKIKRLEVQADIADKIDRSKAKHKNPDPGFSTYEAATARAYDRHTSQLKPDMAKYAEEKAQLGEEFFYPTADTLVQGKHKDSKEAIDRMCTDLEKQAEKRAKFKRRRPYDPEAPIDFVNDQNRRFNRKIERFYGEYTQDIKNNIERGTAV